jgi:SNF2 family DNA or RNA helicase
MHADLSVERREALVGVFQGSRKADSTVGRGHPFRVLVGSSRLLGQGVTLNKANRLVLMEPGRHAGVEAQIADRVHRIGSRTDRCWFYRLINSASTLERLLVDDQEGQVQQQLLIDWFNRARETEHGGDADLAQFLDYGEGGDEASGGNEGEETEDILDM